MKKYKILGLIAFLFLTFFSCEELADPAGLRGEAVVPVLKDVDPAVFDSNDINNTFVQFTVDLNEADKASVSEVAVQVSYNGKQQRVEFAKVTAFPSTLKVKLTDVAAKLGLDISKVKLGDVFGFEIVTTSNGNTYRSNASFNAGVVCAYNSNLATGTYVVDGGDWGSKGEVTITVDPNDPFIVYVAGLEAIEGLDEDKGPLKMVINSKDFSVKAPRTILASSLAPWGLDYTNIAYEGTGTLDTCTGTYKMSFTISVDQGTFGTYTFILTKK